MLLLGLLVLIAAGSGLIEFLSRYTVGQLGHRAWLSTDPGTLQAHLKETLWELSQHLLPIFGLLAIGAIAANLVQTGFLFLPEKLKPDPVRINPLEGLRRLFSLSSTSRLGLGLLKILVIGTVAWIDLSDKQDALLGLVSGSPARIGLFASNVLLWTSLKIGVALLALAMLDYALLRWKHEQDLKMTPQELREEMRNSEGNPELRARRRRIQEESVGAHVTQAIPNADVVVASSVGQAVAIRYDPLTMATPVVVAKGAGLSAKRIRQLALNHCIPLLDRPLLAQVLHRAADVGQPIPHEQYAAVAKLLAEVFQRQGKTIDNGEAVG